MKIIQMIIAFLYFTAISCNDVGNNTFSKQEVQNKSDESNKRKLQNLKEEIEDSTIFSEALTLALSIADNRKDENEFSIKSDTLDINYGFLFSLKTKHLIVKRHFQWQIRTDIYKFHNNQFISVCAKHLMAYIDDTIWDVNGDKKPDYLFHWYPSAGCCARDIFDVFLQKEDGDFSNELEFVNPHFFPSEKLVRGRCYGTSAPLYKFKWNENTVDTIEYIFFPDSVEAHHFLRKKRWDENEKGQILDELPKEYKGIE